MKNLFVRMAALAVCSAATLSIHAAPVGTMTCNALPAFNVSYYTFGVSSSVTISGTASGAGAGKPILSSLDIHTSLTQFTGLFSAALTGKDFTTCNLVVKGNDGSSVSFDFKDVIVSSVTVTAASGLKKDEEKAAFTDATLTYLGVRVVATSGGDDGGSTPTGWDKANNLGAGNNITSVLE